MIISTGEQPWRTACLDLASVTCHYPFENLNHKRTTWHFNAICSVSVASRALITMLKLPLAVSGTRCDSNQTSDGAPWWPLRSILACRGHTNPDHSGGRGMREKWAAVGPFAMSARASTFSGTLAIPGHPTWASATQVFGHRLFHGVAHRHTCARGYPLHESAQAWRHCCQCTPPLHASTPFPFYDVPPLAQAPSWRCFSRLWTPATASLDLWLHRSWGMHKPALQLHAHKLVYNDAVGSGWRWRTGSRCVFARIIPVSCRLV